MYNPEKISRKHSYDNSSTYVCGQKSYFDEMEKDQKIWKDYLGIGDFGVLYDAISLGAE